MKRIYILLIPCLMAALALPIYSQLKGQVAKGLSALLFTDRERYEVGQPLDLTVSLHNTSERQLTYDINNSPVCDFWILDADGREIWRYSKTKSFAGRIVLKLAVGESRLFEAVWNQTDNQGRKVKPGWYTVYARFAASPTSQEPMKARVRIGESLSGQTVLYVPVNSEAINPAQDIGKKITIEGVLRQSPQGMYVEVRDIKLQR